MRKIVNLLRSNYLFSLVASLLLFPVQRICRFIERQIRMKVWINGRMVTYDGLQVTFPRGVGFNFASNIYWNDVDGFEPYTWKTMRHFLERADAFYDIGSNIGFYSVLARKLRPEMNIEAFEPVPPIFTKNQLLQRKNGVSVNLHQAAVSDQNGSFTIYLPVREDGVEEETTATLKSDSWQSKSDAKVAYEVNTVTLDDFGLSQFNSVSELLIKVDVEDFEASVFSGGKAFMSEVRPVVICEMLQREHGNQETVSIIEEMDYVIYAITSSGLFRFMPDDFFKPRSFTEFLVVPKERLDGAPQFLSYKSLLSDVQFGSTIMSKG